MRINFKMTLSKLLFFIPLIYIIICLFIYFYQRNLLYHPGENNYLDEGPLTHKIQKISVNSKNDLVGWYFFKNKNFKTILFFHGNAGKLDNRIYKLNEFEKMDVFLLIGVLVETKENHLNLVYMRMLLPLKNGLIQKK